MRMLWSCTDFTGREKFHLIVKEHFNMQLLYYVETNVCIAMIISDLCCGYCVTTTTCHNVEVINLFYLQGLFFWWGERLDIKQDIKKKTFNGRIKPSCRVYCHLAKWGRLGPLTIYVAGMTRHLWLKGFLNRCQRLRWRGLSMKPTAMGPRPSCTYKDIGICLTGRGMRFAMSPCPRQALDELKFSGFQPT